MRPPGVGRLGRIMMAAAPCDSVCGSSHQRHAASCLQADRRPHAECPRSHARERTTLGRAVVRLRVCLTMRLVCWESGWQRAHVWPCSAQALPADKKTRPKTAGAGSDAHTATRSLALFHIILPLAECRSEPQTSKIVRSCPIHFGSRVPCSLTLLPRVTAALSQPPKGSHIPSFRETLRSFDPTRVAIRIVTRGCGVEGGGEGRGEKAPRQGPSPV